MLLYFFFVGAVFFYPYLLLVGAVFFYPYLLLCDICGKVKLLASIGIHRVALLKIPSECPQLIHLLNRVDHKILDVFFKVAVNPFKLLNFKIKMAHLLLKLDES